ncbi:hypothetical protein AAFF_G00256530 [Aldrovandia affinis]|uniref:G-protein coupled receptors family 1 profile domain-containing protein n=1 Tax=Aldrovandia affinis TaxID=143900 RepID=A0AAD7WU02_9TELE|nr:hypothetical protein AAFF_G00256530 [Aldrovandia affinis]
MHHSDSRVALHAGYWLGCGQPVTKTIEQAAGSDRERAQPSTARGTRRRVTALGNTYVFVSHRSTRSLSSDQDPSDSLRAPRKERPHRTNPGTLHRPPAPSTPLMEVLQSLSSAASCPHLYDSANGSVVLEHYNRTGRLLLRRPPDRGGGIGAAKASFLFISVCIVLENLLVLLAVLFRVRLRHRWVYICVANITLSDLLAGAAYVLNLFMSGGRTFRLSPALWLFREGVLFVALAASIFSLLLIAVERYTTMMKPLHQKSARKTYRVYGLVLLCWLLAFAIGFLPLLGWNCVCRLDECSTLLPLYSRGYILFCLVLFSLILLAIGALYGAIYWHVRGSSGGEADSTRSRQRSMRLLKTVMCIVGAFVACWGPLFVLLLVDFVCGARGCGPLRGVDWVIALAVLNSAVNPVIYALGSSELRRAIAGLLCCYLAGFLSKETNSTSGGSHRHSSLRNSFNRVRNMSTSPPPPPPTTTRPGSPASAPPPPACLCPPRIRIALRPPPAVAPHG